MSAIEIFEWYVNPLELCSGHAVIGNPNFLPLAEALKEEDSALPATVEEIVEIFTEQSKRFSACGANNSDKYGVLRKSSTTGWQYLLDAIQVV